MPEQQTQSGFLLISTLIVLSIMIMIASFYLNDIMQEIQVADIVDTSPQTYYLAEAGIQEAIWKIQNDPTWKTNFESDPAWSATFTRPNALLSGGGYTVTVANQEAAHAMIFATSTIAVRGTTAQRVVSAEIYKALNTEPLKSTSLYANNIIKGTGSQVAVSGGGIFANEDIKLAEPALAFFFFKVQRVQDEEDVRIVLFNFGPLALVAAVLNG